VLLSGGAGALNSWGQDKAANLSDYATGSWTPSDQSGASLSFTGVDAGYTRIGNMVFAYCTLQYPVTASGAVAVIGGLPYTVANRSGAVLPQPIISANINTPGVLLYTVKNTTTFKIYNENTLAFVLNSTLSNDAFNFGIVYPIA
jgi:hypothetical protein